MNKYFENKFKKINSKELSSLLWEIYVEEDSILPKTNDEIHNATAKTFYEHLHQYVFEHKVETFDYIKVEEIISGHFENYIIDEYQSIASNVSDEL